MFVVSVAGRERVHVTEVTPRLERAPPSALETLTTEYNMKQQLWMLCYLQKFLEGLEGLLGELTNRRRANLQRVNRKSRTTLQ